MSTFKRQVLTTELGTGVGNVSAFKRQFLYNRIGKVSGFFLIDISIISNTIE